MLLEVKELSVQFRLEKQTLTAVNKVSFSLDRKESIGIVGESGCGKSTTAYALMNLLPANGKISGGQVLVNGVDMTSANTQLIRKTRWKDIAMVFQNAMTALNPVQKIGVQIINALKEHEDVSDAEARERAEYIFQMVGISPKRLMQYPHEFSGGMKQRTVIALALICRPKVLLADEPTTALDVVAQRQVLELLISLQDKFALSLALISHDISVVVEVCKTIAVMYGGEILEIGPARDVLIHCNHPYTHALVGSFPSLHRPIKSLTQISGSPPNLLELRDTCPFEPRCVYAQTICRAEPPPLRQVRSSKMCRCHFAEELEFNLN